MAVCVGSAGSVYINFIYMGAPTEVLPCREAEAAGGALENASGEKERKRGITEQLPIYTGGEYLAPVCKAFNGES